VFIAVTACSVHLSGRHGEPRTFIRQRRLFSAFRRQKKNHTNINSKTYEIMFLQFNLNYLSLALISEYLLKPLNIIWSESLRPSMKGICNLTEDEYGLTHQNNLSSYTHPRQPQISHILSYFCSLMSSKFVFTSWIFRLKTLWETSPYILHRKVTFIDYKQ
jgi:hypothetical protein